MNGLMTNFFKDNTMSEQETYPKMGDVLKSSKLVFEGHDEWVVTEARWQPPRQGIFEGWHITVQQLNPDGTYNERGFVHSFYASGDFNNLIEPKDVEIVRTMKRVFI